MRDLKTHYMKELGFLASFAQLCGATVFWVSTRCNSITEDSQLILNRYPGSLRSLELTTRCLRVCLMGFTECRRWLGAQVCISIP